MMRLARLSLAAAALFLVVACHGDRAVTPDVAPPSFTLDDGTRTGGNPDFFFLPPIVPNPSGHANFDAGEFNPDLLPVVNVCELTDNPSNGSVDCKAGPLAFGPVTAQASVADEHYRVNWHTDESNGGLGLNLNGFYRIQVFVSAGGTRLGFADVDPVNNLKELKNVQTGDVFGLVDGRTLPIKFRIENGALCEGGGPCTSETIALDAPGGNVIVLEGTGDQVTIPQQASGQVVTVTLQLCRDEAGNLKSIDVDLRKFGNCIRITAEPSLEAAFSPKARVDICSLFTEYPDLPGEQEHLITLHRQDGNEVRALPHAFGNVCGGVSSAPAPGLRSLAAAGWRWVRRGVAALVTPRPLYARAMLLDVGEVGGLTDGFSDFQLALPAKMDYVDPDDASRTAPAGTSLPTAVRVTDARDQFVQGATVMFTVPAIEGPGTVLATAVSDANGIARVSWPIVEGTNTLVASGRGIAAQNNYEGTVRPFMPDIVDDETQLPLSAEQREAQLPVLLHTGEVEFTATGTVAGGLYLIRDSDDMLQRLDPTSLVITNVGELGVGYAFGDCAWNPANSTLYMVEGRTANTLYTVNLTTGAATAVGAHGITDMFAIGYHPPTNALYGASQDGNLYALTLATGAATLIGATGLVSSGSEGGAVNGLAWDPVRSQFVALVANVGGGALYSVNVATAAVTFLASSPGIDNLGLTYDPTIDRFWAADFTGGIFQYNPASGYARTTLATGEGQHTCIAHVP